MPYIIPINSQPGGEGIKARSIAMQAKPKAEVQPERPKHPISKAVGNAPGLKREPSDIFKSFSKSKSKLTRQETSSSVDANTAIAIPQSVSKRGIVCNFFAVSLTKNTFSGSSKFTSKRYVDRLLAHHIAYQVRINGRRI